MGTHKMASNRRIAGTHSRHFEVKTPPARASISSATSSVHFLHSPTSALGSVCSFPDFLTALLPPNYGAQEEDFQQEECTCQRLAQAVRAQFAHCPTFLGKRQEQLPQRAYSSSGSSGNQEGRKSCCRAEIDALQDCVCHLCAHGCYLRAFAPMREWHALRLLISEQQSTSASIDSMPADVLLKGWRCSLAPSTKDARLPFERHCSSTRKRTRTPDEPEEPLLQVLFASPDGKTFKGRHAALKAIGIHNPTKREEESPFVGPGARLLYHSTTRQSPTSPTHPHVQCADERTTYTNTVTDTVNKRKRRRTRPPLRPPTTCTSVVSPFGLLEELFGNHPWRLLLCTIMLNRTTRCQVDPVLHAFLLKWPNAQSASVANETEVAQVIRSMGMCNKRARGIIRFSQDWLQLLTMLTKSSTREPHAVGTSCPSIVARNVMNDDNKDDTIKTVVSSSSSDHDAVAFLLTRQHVLGLYNCGDYAYDAYRIFVQGDLDVITTDHALQIYVDYHRGCRESTMHHD